MISGIVLPNQMSRIPGIANFFKKGHFRGPRVPGRGRPAAENRPGPENVRARARAGALAGPRKFSEKIFLEIFPEKNLQY